MSQRISNLQKSIATDIKQYDSQGFHRTGTKGHFNFIKWIMDEITSVGLNPARQFFPFQKIDIQTSILKVGNKNIEGLPLFDATYTDTAEISGTIGKLDSDAALGVTHVSFDEYKSFDKIRRITKHRGLIAITQGCSPGLIPLNAYSYEKPFGPPVLQISSEYWPWLNRKLHEMEATLKINMTKSVNETCNIITQIEGSSAILRPLIVTTPTTGWWHCASERGIGITCFLQMIRNLVGRHPKRDVIFLATAGHEIGYLGLKRYIIENKELLGRNPIWIHLGASPNVKTRLYSTENQFKNIALNSLIKSGIVPEDQMPVGSRPHSEAAEIFDIGGSFISVMSSNSMFHHVNDRWPFSVDLSKTQKLSEAMINLAFELSMLEI